MQEDVQEGYQPEQRRDPQQVGLPLPISKPRVTYILLVIIVALFAAPLLATGRYRPDNALIQWGALIFDNVLYGKEYYRLFTSMFFHLNIVHIGFNAYALYYFGRQVEQTFGYMRFILIYFLGGLTSSVASFALTRQASLGASGAIFAIFAAEMVFLYKNRSVFGKEANRQLQSLVVMALLNLGIGIYSQLSPVGGMVIDNWGHIGGFVAGFVLAWVITPRYAVKAEANNDPTAPPSLKVVNVTPQRNTWIAGGLYSAGLLLAFLIALSILSAMYPSGG
jgi:rhomboid protease GluP